MFATYINTPLGQVIAITDQDKLCFLDFADGFMTSGNAIDFAKIAQKLGLRAGQAGLELKTTPLHHQLNQELNQYFAGKLQKFTVKVKLSGTPFQQKVWQGLMAIPFGQTRSYEALAESLNMPKAFRAVANANGANRIAIVIPCHRVIRKSGALGGFASGIDRKIALLGLEGSEGKI